jgi:hypothetical protein
MRPTKRQDLADPVTAANFRRGHPGLLFLQNRNDLLFTEPASLHSSGSLIWQESTQISENLRAQTERESSDSDLWYYYGMKKFFGM